MKYSILIFVLFSIIQLHAQKSITVEVSSDSVEVGDIIELKYSLQNIEEKFSLPDLSDFEVISGPSVATSMSIINGVKSQKASYTLYIQFENEGNFTIPGFEINEGENRIIVPDIMVKVVSKKLKNSTDRDNRIARQRSMTIKAEAGNSQEETQQPKTVRKLRKL